MSDSQSTNVFRRALRLLESRVLSFWVIGAWVALTAVWVIPFQISGQSAQTVRAIAEDWMAFRIVYAAVGLTTLACSWTRLSRDITRIQRFDDSDPVMTPGAVQVQLSDLDAIEARLERRRYTVRRGENSLRAVKHRYSLLGGSMFHFGLVLLGAALVAHVATMDAVTFRVTEGQAMGEAAMASGVASVPSEIRYLTLDSIEPEYFEDVLLFTRLEATMHAVDDSVRTVTLSAPYWAGPTTLLSITDFNLAPHVEVTRPDGTTDEYVFAMNLNPPGTEDAADIPDVPLDVTMVAYPDHGVVDGKDVSLSYNIVDPAFLVSVKHIGRAGALLARELVKIGEPVEAEGYTIRVSGLSRYGTFRVTTAPMLPFIGLSLLAVVAGLAWRYLLRRRHVVAWATDDGVFIDGWLDIGGRSAGRAAIVDELRRAGVIQ